MSFQIRVCMQTKVLEYNTSLRAATKTVERNRNVEAFFTLFIKHLKQVVYQSSL